MSSPSRSACFDRSDRPAVATRMLVPGDTRPISKVKRLQKARFSRVSADQDDKVTRPTVWAQKTSSLVEEVKIDLLTHDIDYWNWDLPETWWEGIRDWLDRPISPLARGQVKKMDRRLIVVYHGHVRDSGNIATSTRVDAAG
ncbi:hypothetical protein P171DRAFT_486865 [Karstenula rhodostoma CBS 690.94]|uniref:Uncharacterized protein n=1 Tax=Karstenula rhodostoma CBS 690.94 TaxID=1392251 RepID=A0A9P4UAC2_9PLEO|nr:hypothetical protein P171DRAFT_486865 [Karstenula rhodostoma CBS 690.94]